MTNAVKEANDQLRAKLDAAALQALHEGHSWAEGPIVMKSPNLFEPFSLSEPIRYELKVKAGPVDHDWQPPNGWRMIRHTDWIAAGKPGVAQIPTKP